MWFQNRRTKYKRMKQEEAESGEGGNKGKSHFNYKEIKCLQSARSLDSISGELA